MNGLLYFVSQKMWIIQNEIWNISAVIKIAHARLWYICLKWSAVMQRIWGESILNQYIDLLSTVRGPAWRYLYFRLWSIFFVCHNTEFPLLQTTSTCTWGDPLLFLQTEEDWCVVENCLAGEVLKNESLSSVR